MNLWPTIYQRDLTEALPITPRNVDYNIAAYSHHNIGGPYTATINCVGDDIPIFELIELLRCPVEITSELVGITWWGYVNSVVVRSGPYEFRVSLDSMYNRVSVAYSFVQAGSTSVGQRKTTAVLADDDSSGEYGIKRLVYSTGGATDAQADQLNAVMLARFKYPQVQWQLSTMNSMPTLGVGRSTAVLECKGWWSVIGWRYYAKSTTTSVDTASQIAAIVDVSEHIAGTEIYTASGISSSEYRNGESTCLAEAVELMEQGTTSGDQYQVIISKERVAHIQTEPRLGTADWLMDRTGQLYDPLGNPTPAVVCPAGMWVKLADVIPASADLTKLANAAVAFIERGDYSVSTNRYTPITRGLRSPWDLGKVILR